MRMIFSRPGTLAAFIDFPPWLGANDLVLKIYWKHYKQIECTAKSHNRTALR
jgi:hypothetical protein